MFEPQISYGVCEEGGYMLEVDFDAEGEFSDSFGIDVDWVEYQQFAYADLPIQIGPFTTDEWTDYYLLFYDLSNHDCCTQITIDGQVCPAEISIIGSEVGECREDGSFPVTLEYEGFGFLKVDVFQDYEYLCSYSASENPLILDSIYSTEKELTLKLCPSGVEAECAKVEVAVPEDCIGIACGFATLEYAVTPCDSGEFFLELALEPAGEHGDYFLVEGPEGYRKELLYGDSLYRLGPFPGGSIFYEFHVADLKQDDCYATLSVGRIVCPEQCDILASTMSAICIGENKVIVTIDSLTSLHGGYDVYIDDEAFGFYKQSKFPLELKVETLRDSIEVTVCVSDNTTCCIAMLLDVGPCEVQCKLDGFVIDTTGCDGTSYYLNIDFKKRQEEGRFNLYLGDSLLNDYSYVDLPLKIGPFIADADRKYEFVAVDAQDSACMLVKKVGPFLCPSTSQFFEEQIVVLRCNGLERFVKVPAMFSEPTVMHLFNSNGLVVDQRNISSESKHVVLHIDRPPAGIYVLRLRSAKGLVSRKVIIP